MAIRLSINGFGRIGRLVLRLALEHPKMQVVAINDVLDPDHLAYLFKYDSVHGPFQGEVSHSDHHLIVGGKKILITSEKDPANLPWKEQGVECVVEATGCFTKKQDAKKHLDAGKDGVPTFVMGVNHETYNPQTDDVFCNASCTTNCLAPLCRVLIDHFGIEEGLMTTVHSVTASQPSVDSASKKDWRAGRASGINIIPSSTGAAKATVLCLPELKNKLTAMSFRVPTADVSAVDLTVRLKKKTSYDAICSAMRKAAKDELRGILQVTDEPLVSSDFISNRHSCIFDERAGIALNENFYKLIAWYDNEMGYAARVIDMLEYVGKRDAN
jgi:glyceraldehyde 3-phosphate dehydrogenase